MNPEMPVSLLYIGSDDKSNDLIDKLNNANIPVVHYSNSLEAIQFLQTNKVFAIFIEHPIAPIKTEATLSFIRGELNISVPVYLYKYNSKDQVAEHSENYILLPDDLTAEHILELQKDLRNKDKEKCYSLSYLREVSDNNEEFILQSIEIFIDSVKENLALAGEAYQNGNYERVGEIAHAIKPSFEMLENKEASPHCDELTYNRENKNMSIHLSELNRIFKNISFQLKEFLDKDYEKNISG